MNWLRKQAEEILVIVNHPEMTRSGVCPFCTSLEGEPVSEVGSPPFHDYCACEVRATEIVVEVENILEEDFQMTPEESVEPERDPGGTAIVL